MPSFKKLKVLLAPIGITLLLAGVITASYLIQKPKNVDLGFAALLGDCNQDAKVDILDFQLLSNSFGKTSGQTGYNAKCDFNSDSKVDILDFQVLSNNFGKTGTATNTPTSTPSVTKAPTPTASGPTPTPNTSLNPWGIYPNCVAPAMPVEAQTWWIEKANPQPGDEIPFGRHIHAATCMPHARDTAGKLVTVKGTLNFTRVIMIHNSNIRITKGDNGFPDSGNVEFPVRFNPALTCPNRGNCVFYSNNSINTTVRPDGLHELRWRVEGTHPDLSGNTEFISFATKIYIKNGTTVNSTATSPDPRARGWYEGVLYDAAEIANYDDLYKGRTDITVPVVSGTVALQMNHTQSVGGTLRSKLFLDPDFHNRSVGTILYDKPGLFKGTYSLDTTRFPNGRHALVMQTEHTATNGIHSGLLKLFIDIRN